MKKLLLIPAWLRHIRFWDNLLNYWQDRAARARRKIARLLRKRRPLPAFVPRVENLEVRWLPSTLQFVQGTFTVNENVGTASFEVERTGSTSSTDEIEYDTSNGTATAWTNYEAVSGGVASFAVGQSTAYSTVTIDDLGLVGGQEYFQLSLTCCNPGDTISSSLGTATIVILNNDPAFYYSASNYNVNEDAGLVTITVERTSTAGTTSVEWIAEPVTATPSEDYGSSGTASFAAGVATATFTVDIVDNYAAGADQYLQLSLSCPQNGFAIDPVKGAAAITIVENDGVVLTNDPLLGTDVPFGPATLSPYNGNLSVSVPFTIDASVDPLALVYNSDSAAPKPIVQIQDPVPAWYGVPTDIQTQLTWNSTPQGWVTFSTTGHSAGDTYLLGSQVASAVTSTGYYPWSIEVKAYVTGTVLDNTISGYAAVVVNNASSYGYGWSIADLDSLVSVSGGELYVSGTGGARFFATGPYGTFVSPPQDTGTLVQDYGGGYTYTTAHQEKYNFNSSGQLTSIVDPSGVTTTFAYSSGRLSTISTPAGNSATFSYSSGELTSIQLPGSRTVTVSINGSSDLASVTNPDGSQRNFSYSSHLLVTDFNGLITTTYSYSSAATLTGISGQGGSLTVAPAALVGLSSVAANASDSVGVLTDALGNATTYTMDDLGTATQLANPIGDVAMPVDYSGQPASLTDALGNTTYYYYDSAGNVIRVIYPDGSTQVFTYDDDNNLLTATDQNNNEVSYTYNGSDEILTMTDALGNTTSYTWSNGRMQTMTNPLGQTTSYTYNSARELQTVTNPLGGVTTYGYDAEGDQTTVTNPLGQTTTTLYDAMGRVTSVTLPGGQTSYTYYNVAGQITETSMLWVWPRRMPTTARAG
jgi:YD repeat-containing protein